MCFKSLLLKRPGFSEFAMNDMTLWPPIDEVRRALGLAPDRTEEKTTVACSFSAVADREADSAAGSGDLPDTLRTLVERRADVAMLPKAARWSSGDIVAVPAGNGVLMGVLLDEPAERVEDGKALVWRGWLTCAEVDWAAAHDLVLEPQDEPFDPAVGVVQTWNSIWIREAQTSRLGCLTAARMAAARAVHDEFTRGASGSGSAADAQPGRIGLRTVGGFTVLTGTPLGEDDPRIEFRAAYQAVGERLSVGRPATKVAVASLADPSERRFWHWLVSGLTRGRPTRIVLAGACAVILGVTVRGLSDAPTPRATMDDDVRFRSLPAPESRAELSVRWRDAADVRDIEVLLRSFGGEVVGGPNAAGRWQVRVPDVAAAQRAMLASPLVAEVVGP